MPDPEVRPTGLFLEASPRCTVPLGSKGLGFCKFKDLLDTQEARFEALNLLIRGM
jgi:hypothetical protein